jgi:hypothetical protein
MGSETLRGLFSVIPREWDNLITSIQLLHYDIKPELLFESLEHNRGLEFLNLNHVKFTDSLQARRAVLPNLKSFVLDLTDFEYCRSKGESSCTEKDPASISKTLFKSLLFFDKYEAGWPVKDISLQRTNIELTVQTAKLFVLDFSKGRLVCQVLFCSEILESLSLSQEFTLRHLALRNGQLNLRPLQGLETKDLKSLVLESVSLQGGRISELLGKLNSLEDLRLSAVEEAPDAKVYTKSQKIASQSKSESEFDGDEIKPIYDTAMINLQDLPETLKHFCVTKTGFQISKQNQVSRKSSSLSPLRIVFPEDEDLQNRNFKPFKTFPNLETFFCDSCELDVEVLKNFDTIFRNVKRLIFFGEQAISVPLLLKNLPNLQTLFLEILRIGIWREARRIGGT